MDRIDVVHLDDGGAWRRMESGWRAFPPYDPGDPIQVGRPLTPSEVERAERGDGPEALRRCSAGGCTGLPFLPGDIAHSRCLRAVEAPALSHDGRGVAVRATWTRDGATIGLVPPTPPCLTPEQAARHSDATAAVLRRLVAEYSVAECDIDVVIWNTPRITHRSEWNAACARRAHIMRSCHAITRAMTQYVTYGTHPIKEIEFEFDDDESRQYADSFVAHLLRALDGTPCAIPDTNGLSLVEPL